MSEYIVSWPEEGLVEYEVSAENLEEAVAAGRARARRDGMFARLEPLVREAGQVEPLCAKVGDDYWYGRRWQDAVGSVQFPDFAFKRMTQDEVADVQDEDGNDNVFAVGFVVEMRGDRLANWGVGRKDGETRWTSFGSDARLGRMEYEYESREDAMRGVYDRLTSGALEHLMR